MAEIAYDNTLEDLRAFMLFHLERVPAGRALVRRGQVAAGAFGLVLGAVATYAIFKNLLVAVALGAVVSVASAVLGRPMMVRSGAKNVERMLRGGKTAGILGWHKVSVEGDTLREAHEAGSKSTAIPCIDGIFERPDYVFVYLNAAEAHVIPRKRVSNGSVDEFVAMLRAAAHAG